MVNKATGYTIVGGHQKVSVLDELNKYNDATHEGDYTLRVELIEVDIKTEKELNITLNNHRVGGDWDYNALRVMLPEVDYQAVGFTAEDLSVIGVDYFLQTETESEIASAIDSLYSTPTRSENAGPKPSRGSDPIDDQDRVEHMRAVKHQVRQEAQSKAEDLNAYVVISFDSFEAKAQFCEAYGYNAYEKFIKGEVFVEQIEGFE